MQGELNKIYVLDVNYSLTLLESKRYSDRLSINDVSMNVANVWNLYKN